MDERVHDDPFAHPVAEVRVDYPHDRRVGQGGVGEQMIDARAKREDRLKVRQVRERAWRMAPGERVPDLGAVERLAERRDRMRRQQRVELLAPGHRLPARDGDKNAHSRASPIRSIAGSAGAGRASAMR